MFKSKNTLRYGMVANALFSFVSGFVSISISNKLMTLFALSDTKLFVYLGITLILFAVWVASIALQKTINLNSAKATIILDFLWVISSAVILSLCHVSDRGLILIIAISIVVLLFALAQVIGIYKLLF